jgi:hypothetical protein
MSAVAAAEEAASALLDPATAERVGQALLACRVSLTEALRRCSGARSGPI